MRAYGDGDEVNNDCQSSDVRQTPHPATVTAFYNTAAWTGNHRGNTTQGRLSASRNYKKPPEFEWVLAHP
jgi:hypothetical protein